MEKKWNCEKCEFCKEKKGQFSRECEFAKKYDFIRKVNLRENVNFGENAKNRFDAKFLWFLGKQFGL